MNWFDTVDMVTAETSCSGMRRLHADWFGMMLYIARFVTRSTRFCVLPLRLILSMRQL